MYGIDIVVEISTGSGAPDIVVNETVILSATSSVTTKNARPDVKVAVEGPRALPVKRKPMDPENVVSTTLLFVW